MVIPMVFPWSLQGLFMLLSQPFSLTKLQRRKDQKCHICLFIYFSCKKTAIGNSDYMWPFFKTNFYFYPKYCKGNTESFNNTPFSCCHFSFSKTKSTVSGLILPKWVILLSIKGTLYPGNIFHDYICLIPANKICGLSSHPKVLVSVSFKI